MNMKSLYVCFVAMLFLVVGSAHADVKADCEAKAVSKDGKPLAGAAKNAKVKKCMKDAVGAVASAAGAASAACEAAAVDKNGKPLHGAAKAAVIEKCEKNPPQ